MPTILGELRHYFRDSTWHVRPPRAVQEAFLAIEHARAGVEAATGRPATVVDLAGHLRRSPKAIAKGLGAADCRQPRSLEDPIADADDMGTLADIVGAHDAGYDQAEARATVARLARVLSDRDREVIRLRFVDGLLQSEIAERVGCSQMHVSRILRHSIDAMALHARLAA